MIVETALVTKISGNDITVQCESRSACDHCHASESCTTGAVSKAFPQRTHQLVVQKTADVVVGDRIEIGLKQKNIVTSAMLVYLLPLAFILLFTVLGQYLSHIFAVDGELLIILSAFFGGISGFTLARKISVKYEQHFDFKPKMLSVLEKQSVIAQWRLD